MKDIKMRTLPLIFIIACPFVSFSQGNTYTVNGQMPAEHAHLTLTYNKGNNTHVREQADVIGGKFVFKGTIDAPYKAYITVSYPGAGASNYDDHFEFFLDAGTTNIQTADSLKNATISGTKLVTDGLAYDKPMTELLTTLTKEYEDREKSATEDEKKTETYKQAMAAIDDSFLVRQKRMNLAFIRSHPDSRLNLYIFREQTYGWEYAELAPLFASLSPGIRNSVAGKQYADRLARLKLVALGQPAPEFSHPDSTGKMVSLSSFRGKYVLIDFWASWCGPCRGESPYLVAAYDKYRNYNFTIIGISLDKKPQRSAWLHAIREDKLFWTQLSDLSDVNPVVQLYGVKGIPQNFLIAPDGRIIAHNLRGEMLDKKLSELIKVPQLMSFSVQGRIGNYSAPYKAYLSYVSPDGLRTDSTELSNGSFGFSGKVKSPRKAYLSIGSTAAGQNLSRDSYKVFFVEGEPVTIESPDSLSHALVHGGKTNSEWAELESRLKDAKDKQRTFTIEMDYMRAHPDSWVSLMCMLDDYYAGQDLAPYKPLFDAFTPELKASSAGLYLSPMFRTAEQTAIGVTAMDFSIPDAAGRKHSLHEFRGRYVLVDFWASWCGPCRAENPNVLKAYNAYKAKGFTVVGISIDDAKDKSKWLEAIKIDAMPWTQLSELKGWDTPVTRNYGITAIPQNFLLDREGRIIAKGLRGEDLMNKLAELMK